MRPFRAFGGGDKAIGGLYELIRAYIGQVCRGASFVHSANITRRGLQAEGGVRCTHVSRKLYISKVVCMYYAYSLADTGLHPLNRVWLTGVKRVYVYRYIG